MAYELFNLCRRKHGCRPRDEMLEPMATTNRMQITALAQIGAVTGAVTRNNEFERLQ